MNISYLYVLTKLIKGGLDLIEFCKRPIPTNTKIVPYISQPTLTFVPGGNLVQTIMQNVGEIRLDRNVTSSRKDMATPSRSYSSHGKGRLTEASNIVNYVRSENVDYSWQRWKKRRWAHCFEADGLTSKWSPHFILRSLVCQWPRSVREQHGYHQTAVIPCTCMTTQVGRSDQLLWERAPTSGI